jgi:hypothetical protein
MRRYCKANTRRYIFFFRINLPWHDMLHKISFPVNQEAAPMRLPRNNTTEVRRVRNCKHFMEFLREGDCNATARTPGAHFVQAIHGRRICMNLQRVHHMVMVIVLNKSSVGRFFREFALPSQAATVRVRHGWFPCVGIAVRSWLRFRQKIGGSLSGTCVAHGEGISDAILVNSSKNKSDFGASFL